MAKGVEDTAFYRYHRLVALNEVGGDPGTFGGSVAQWLEHCTRLARNWPAAMTTLSTHDTKRSEDVRARILVLAEIPGEWATAVDRWRSRASRHGPPDANIDYLFWQTLVGAWPLTVDRMQAYLAKASREAKQHTSWTAPDERYDAALSHYVEHVFGDDALLLDVESWVEQHLRAAGEVNSLSQKLLQLTMPGVPDVYQGQELTDRSLVDPDNRRPVDYTERGAALDRFDRGDVTATETKLRVTATVLRLRRARPTVFAGGYVPLDATGPAADHVIAYRRTAPSGAEIMAVATRLPMGLSRCGGWGDTSLTATLEGDWRDLLTGRPGTIDLAELLTELPVALLVRDEG
jgi:(1->4)-alpha-D-glucan 1-alpha-D-glucosylmutase